MNKLKNPEAYRAARQWLQDNDPIDILDNMPGGHEAEKIYREFGCAVLMKGGHQQNDANDYLYGEEGGTWFYGKRIDNPNTHGTGCTLSSAIAANLAKGCSLSEAVKMAKNYLSGALAAMLDLGRGSGPMNHAYAFGGK